MSRFAELKAAWQDIRADFGRCRTMQRLRAGLLTIPEYKGILREISHHARENPQLQALAATRFRGSQRALVRKFFQHAISEVGHDQLALDDLAALGEDVREVPFQRPLPTTMAVIAYGFYQVERMNPVGYLGYLFHLEFTPTSDGAAYMAALRAIGVPDSAMTFLHDHTTIDIGHNRMMETYANELIATDADLEDVAYAMRVTSRLYAAMLDGAIEDAIAPMRRTPASEELAYGGVMSVA
jgi:hypothetical protein